MTDLKDLSERLKVVCKQEENASFNDKLILMLVSNNWFGIQLHETDDGRVYVIVSRALHSRGPPPSGISILSIGINPTLHAASRNATYAVHDLAVANIDTDMAVDSPIAAP